MIDRLLNFYDQVPSHKRQPYGRIIVMVQNGDLQGATEYARSWWDKCRDEYEVNGNAFWAQDFGIAGCLLNILTGRTQQIAEAN